ncbi:hypothetical protein ACS0ZG_30665 [Burkholderia gladioli]|uniref:hypothetical protein n=1 Tax=Burkholderia gladioli TaxID=28095 RepID=UPI00163FDA20|nr:hypothetical protein [Burkholderia gladioli]MDA0569938.1 hypothetical protein [Burkholderia gladioli]MDA0598242.1 hypothetical protein [Burkholderia gladioli]
MKEPDIAKVCAILQRRVIPVGVVSKTAWTDFYPDQKDCQSSFDLVFCGTSGINSMIILLS